MKENKKIYWIGIILISIIILFLAVMICYGDDISGDEYFSIGFSNNTGDYLFLSQGKVENESVDGWMPGRVIHDYLSVQPGEELSLLQIHRNVREDVHPPLYFFLLNFISGFFTDQVTMVPGHIINILAALVTALMLILICREITGNTPLSLATPILWIFTVGARLSIGYIRMYASVSAIVLLAVYVSIKILQGKRLLIVSALLIWTGVLTHYYFYLCAIPLCGFVAVTLFIRWYRERKSKNEYEDNKRKERIPLWIKYGFVHVMAWACTLLPWPYVFRHLFSSERGVQVQENIRGRGVGGYLIFLKDILEEISYCLNNMVEKLWPWALLLLLLGLVRYNYERSRGREYENNGCINTTYFLMVITVVIIYILIFSKISYSSRWLYLTPVFPLILLICLIVGAACLGSFMPKYSGQVILVLALVLLMTKGRDIYKYSIKSHDEIAGKRNEIMSIGGDALFIYNEWNPLFDNYLYELSEYDRVAIMQADDLNDEKLEELVKQHNNNEKLVLFFQKNMENCEEAVQIVEKKLNLDFSQLKDLKVFVNNG